MSNLTRVFNSKGEKEILEILDGVKGVPRVVGDRREYIPGTDVFDWCVQASSRMTQERRYPISKTTMKGEARRIISMIARILADVHEMGVCHRDVKPENVIIGVDGEVYLIDWEFAYDGKSDFSAATGGKSQAIGTPIFMAPEVFSEDTEMIEYLGLTFPKLCCPASDVWSLGCTAFVIETCSLIMEEKDYKVFVDRVEREGLHSVLPMYSILPPDAQDFLIQTLCVDPSRRPTCRDLLIHPYLETQKQT